MSRGHYIENFNQISLYSYAHLQFPDEYRNHAVEELTCLATWKDNNAHYIVGTLSHSRATSNEERFRCFVYEKINANSGKHGECVWTCNLGHGDLYKFTI